MFKNKIHLNKTLKSTKTTSLGHRIASQEHLNNVCAAMRGKTRERNSELWRQLAAVQVWWVMVALLWRHMLGFPGVGLFVVLLPSAAGSLSA